MIEKLYTTRSGEIHYWTNSDVVTSHFQLIFLPGLTADHRLFDKQIEYFKDKYNVLVWDAPGHGLSWPFKFDFDLMDKARWLNEILVNEKFDNPVLIGQSMGGYVGQAYSEIFPDKIKGFVSIDSAPLQKEYVSNFEIFLLKRMEPVYKAYPWKSLLKTGTNGVATSEYGRKLMHDIMMDFDGDKERYAKLSGHGMNMLAKAYEKNLKYELKCPAILICGDKDKAGSAKIYNKKWHIKTGIPIYWIRNAGHNSNTDKPEEINQIIEDFVSSIK